MDDEAPHFNTRHGHAKRGSKGATYKAWMSMIRRCDNPKQRAYKYYGAKGVYFCTRWWRFENFLADMGERPAGLTLERTNPYGWYTPENCEWVAPQKQHWNKTSTRWITFRGETKCLSEWAIELGIKPKTLRARIDDHGWDIHRALSTPTMRRAMWRSLSTT